MIHDDDGDDEYFIQTITTTDIKQTCALYIHILSLGI